MTKLSSAHNSAQAEFDATYITSSEICSSLDISRCSITYARERGLLPEPIVVAGLKLQLWRRVDINEQMSAWRISLKSRRGQLK